MSFSADIKKEITRTEAKAHCNKAELMSFIRVAGSISPKDGLTLILRTENVTVARRIYTLIREIYGIKTKFIMGKGQRLNKRNFYTLTITGVDAKNILTDIGVISSGTTFELLELDISGLKRCCKAAFLRGCFLACGYLSNPQKVYHLEFVLQNDNIAACICDALSVFGISRAKIIERKGSFVVYVKDSESISDFLALIGAHEATLDMENMRVIKDVKNNVNRLVNCETANLQKTVDAAVRQNENISYIIKNKGLEFLPPKLMEVAEVRLNNPDATLQELCDLMSETVGKSGMNHRLKRIDEIANELRSKLGD